MKLAEILNGIELCDGTPKGASDIEITSVCVDSRRLEPGCLFIALRGTRSDGHDYIARAAQGGAAFVLCEVLLEKEINVPYAITTDTQAALALAAANFYGKPAEKMKIIGVTGTNGKTTVTHLVKRMLEDLTGKPAGIIGTIGDMLGDEPLGIDREALTTPQPIELHRLFAEMLKKGCEYVVMEVSSHALEQKRVAGITFTVGVFTNLTRDHLDFHGSMEEYARVKALLFAQSRSGIVNADDNAAAELILQAKCDISTYSAKSDAGDLVARQIKLLPGKVEFCALMIGEIERTELGIPGLFSVYNALAAMLTLKLLGFELPAAASALARCAGVPGRAEAVPTGRDFTVLIDYAHTPDALENIIKAVREGAEGRVVTLFGCGGDRDKTKRPIMGEIAARLSDYVVVTSDNPRTEPPDEIINAILSGMADTKTPYAVIESRREAIAWAVRSLSQGDTLILAGKGHELYQQIGNEKFDFDERKIVAEAIAAAEGGGAQ
ncbi:MAG: UDP-N-acetylmuramoyl-L-alanyl-D-glutamate--2,6-diaminopimelate ligase [Oscillospiraceae bacterium]|nr:UDP-N-acetylmuramoyl-L-alanyl-D-glutamate--2,6-diaminopimelate ligase [Oscillospiraceae bacterium]